MARYVTEPAMALLGGTRGGGRAGSTRLPTAAPARRLSGGSRRRLDHRTIDLGPPEDRFRAALRDYEERVHLRGRQRAIRLSHRHREAAILPTG